MNEPSHRCSDTPAETGDRLPNEPTVLIADDERQLTDVYARWLDDTCTTRTAYCGDTAMELLNERVDIAVLDRQMPDYSGEEVLAAIREKGLDCRTAIISANEPDLGMLEVEYDLYQVKPLTDPDEFQGLLETLRRRSAYDSCTQRLLALASKKRDIQTYVTESKRRNSSSYSELCEELETLATDVADACDILESEGFQSPF